MLSYNYKHCDRTLWDSFICMAPHTALYWTHEYRIEIFEYEQCVSGVHVCGVCAVCELYTQDTKHIKSKDAAKERKWRKRKQQKSQQQKQHLWNVSLLLWIFSLFLWLWVFFSFCMRFDTQIERTDLINGKRTAKLIPWRRRRWKKKWLWLDGVIKNK